MRWAKGPGNAVRHSSVISGLPRSAVLEPAAELVSCSCAFCDPTTSVDNFEVGRFSVVIASLVRTSKDAFGSGALSVLSFFCPLPCSASSSLSSSVSSPSESTLAHHGSPFSSSSSSSSCTCLSSSSFSPPALASPLGSISLISRFRFFSSRMPRFRFYQHSGEQNYPPWQRRGGVHHLDALRALRCLIHMLNVEFLRGSPGCELAKSTSQATVAVAVVCADRNEHHVPGDLCI